MTASFPPQLMPARARGSPGWSALTLAEPFGQIEVQAPRRGGVSPVALVGSRPAPIRKRRDIAGRGESAAQTMIPPAMALDAVDHHNLALHRLRRRQARP